MSAPAASREAVVRFPDSEAIAVTARVSPLTTTLANVFEVLAGWRRGAPESWIRDARERLRGARLGALSVYVTRGSAVPDFLAPVPARPRACIEQELAELAATDPVRVRREIGLAYGSCPPPELRRFVIAPEDELARVAGALWGFWNGVLAERWPAIERLIEHEISALGRVLVTDGPDALLARLAPAIALRDGRLHRRSAGPGDAGLAGRRLILVPMLAGQDALLTDHLSARDLLVAYPVPGAATIWGAPDEATADGLGAVLGGSRARVLASLHTAATTSDLTSRLGLSAATVSHHLTGLRDQGLVETERHGRRVYYSMTLRGRRLREALT